MLCILFCEINSGIQEAFDVLVCLVVRAATDEICSGNGFVVLGI